MYELLKRGEIKSIRVGWKWIVTRHALAEFLGLPDVDGLGTAAPKAAVKVDEEPDEWTYVVTVKRLRKGEKVRVEEAREVPGRWGR